MTGATIHYDADADLAELDGRTVSILGYGNQGRAQALNLRDSSVEVMVGNREDEYREQAIGDGFEVAPTVFERAVEDGLETGDTLYLSHGYNLTYDLLRASEGVDIVLLPRGWAGGPSASATRRARAFRASWPSTGITPDGRKR